MVAAVDINPELMAESAVVDTFERNLFLVPDDTDPGRTLVAIQGYQTLSEVSQDLETFLAERTSSYMADATPRELAVVALKGEILCDLSEVYLNDDNLEQEAKTEEQVFTYSLPVDQAQFVKGIVVNLAEKRQQARGDKPLNPAYAWLSDPEAPRPQLVTSDEMGVAVYAITERDKVVTRVSA